MLFQRTFYLRPCFKKKKKMGGRKKTAIPTFVNIFVLYIYTVKTASAQVDIVAQKDLLPNFLLRLCL